MMNTKEKLIILRQKEQNINLLKTNIKNNKNIILGKNINDVRELFKDYDIIFREINVNGNSIMVNDDYRIDRLNISTVSNIITKVKHWG